MLSVKNVRERLLENKSPSAKVLKRVDFVLSDLFLTQVFAFLPLKTASIVSLVCKKWRDASIDYFKNAVSAKFGENVVLNFSPIVGGGKISWQDVLRFVTPSLLHFFNLRMNEEWSVNDISSFESSNNVQMSKLNEDQFLLNIVSLPWFFSVINTVDIRVKNVVTGEVYLLESNQNIMVTHLAIEGDFVFALYRNGEIRQWNYRNQTFLGLIETSYSRKDERFEEIRQSLEEDETQSFAFSECFFAHEGRIFLIYDKSFIEVIEYRKNFYSNQLIDFKRLDLDCEGESFPIVLQNKLCCFSEDDGSIRLEVLDLLSMTFIADTILDASYANTIARAVDKNFLYVGAKNKLFLFGINNDNQFEIIWIKKVFGSKEDRILNMGIVEDVIVCCVSNTHRQERIEFLDRNTLETISLRSENIGNNATNFLSRLFS